MEYISHEDYKKILEGFGKQASKKTLTEGLEQEGNAFTAGLAKTKRGGEFKVGDKEFKDRTNYDAPIKEDGEVEGRAEILGHVKNDIYKVKTPKGEVIELEFQAERGEQIDDYAWDGYLEAEDDDYTYYLPASFVTMGGGDYDIDPIYSEFYAEPLRKRGVQEYQFDQMYPDDPGPFEGKDIDKTIKEFLVKENDVDWDKVDDEEAEENQTDNGIEEEVEEGLNPAPFQATGPTIQTVESKHNLGRLAPQERDQLKQYVETIRTVKEEISKMLGKTKMKEGGDMTNLVMKPTTVSEDGEGGDSHEAIEAALGPKHQVIHSAIDKIIGTIKASGFSEGEAALFLQHEIEEKAKEYAGGQFDPH
jgi:hypothetical protein